MFVRLMPGRDIMVNGFGVKGGENGFCKISSIGGLAGVLGVFGRGFSRLRRLLWLLACFGFRGDSSQGFVEGEIFPLLRPPVSMFAGLAREIDPSLLMPFRTPDRKSPGSSSSLSDALEKREDSKESAVGDRVSLFMLNHTRAKTRGDLPTLDGICSNKNAYNCWVYICSYTSSFTSTRQRNVRRKSRSGSCLPGGGFGPNAILSPR